MLINFKCKCIGSLHDDIFSTFCHENLILINCPLSTVHYPLSTIHYQLSLVPCPLSLVPCPLSIVPYQLSLVHCPLSIIPCPLSLVNYPLSIIPCPLSLVHYPLSINEVPYATHIPFCSGLPIGHFYSFRQPNLPYRAYIRSTCIPHRGADVLAGQIP